MDNGKVTRDSRTDLFAEKNLSCPICLEIYEKPVILSCCGNTFCESCVLGMKKHCPYCDKDTDYVRNATVEVLLNSLPAKCICGDYYPKNEIEVHKNVCYMIKMKCKYCQFEGDRKERTIHGIKEHPYVLSAKYLHYNE